MRAQSTWTSLHNVSHESHTEATKVLLAAGADLHCKDNQGKTALHYASNTSHTETAIALVEAGADVNGKDNEGHTALHLASKNGHTKTVKALLAVGADVSSTDNKGWTPVQHAAAKGHLDTTKALEVVKQANEDAAKKKLNEAQAAAWRAKKEQEAEEARKKADAVAAKAEAEKRTAEAQAAAWRAKKAAQAVKDAHAMPANTSSCKLLKQASPLNFGGSAGTKYLELKNRLSPAAKSSFCDTEASQSEAAAAKTEEEGAAKKAYDSACDNYELNMKAEQFGACLHCGKLKKDHHQPTATIMPKLGLTHSSAHIHKEAVAKQVAACIT
jgi:hypothetical protein